MKLCPQCNENIKENAVKCKFCKKDINHVINKNNKENIIVSDSSYQKIWILSLLAIFSVGLHVFFCEWRETLNTYGLLVHDRSIIIPINAESGYGLYADTLLNGNVTLSLLLGILIPFFLIGILVYLYAGWKNEINLIVKKFHDDF